MAEAAQFQSKNQNRSEIKTGVFRSLLANSSPPRNPRHIRRDMGAPGSATIGPLTDSPAHTKQCDPGPNLFCLSYSAGPPEFHIERCPMKKMLLGMVLLASAALFAQTPFDGTWMTRLDTAKLPTKPDKYSLSNNKYECLTCVPKVAVKADGTDQKVTGHPYYDTVAVKVVNASSVEIIEKKDGKVMYTDNENISADGNTLNDKFTDKTGTQPVTGE